MSKTESLAVRLMSVILLVIAGITILIPEHLVRENVRQEREASTNLKTLTSAEADFRANDRDWNHVNDFWTGDVAGLYYVLPNVPNCEAIRLIARGIAEADIRPLQPLVPTPVPFNGYYYLAMDEDDSMGTTPERYYKQDTGGTPSMGKVHNTSQFGFCAYPARYGVTGRYTFLVNENNTIFRSDTGGMPVFHWPDDRGVMGNPPIPPRSENMLELTRRLSWFVSGGFAILAVLVWFAGRRPTSPARGSSNPVPP